MAREIFVDTSGFYACLVSRDNRHKQAAAILAKAARARSRFVTPDYVLDETATLLRMRNRGHLEQRLFDTVFASQACRVEWMDPDCFLCVRSYFRKHAGQDYSFTDCFSFFTMKKLRLTDALTKDTHFRHAGFRPLLA